MICRTWDDNGNAASYAYVADDGQGVLRSQANEMNRTEAVRATQRYVSVVSYGNTQPYFPVWSETGPETPFPSE